MLTHAGPLALQQLLLGVGLAPEGAGITQRTRTNL